MRSRVGPSGSGGSREGTRTRFAVCDGAIRQLSSRKQTHTYVFDLRASSCGREFGRCSPTGLACRDHHAWRSRHSGLLSGAKASSRSIAAPLRAYSSIWRGAALRASEPARAERAASAARVHRSAIAAPACGRYGAGFTLAAACGYLAGGARGHSASGQFAGEGGGAGVSDAAGVSRATAARRAVARWAEAPDGRLLPARLFGCAGARWV